MDKFGRNYSLNVEGSDGTIININPPFTLEFDINRSTLSSANTSSIKVIGLSATNRNLIRKNLNDYGDLRTVTLQAGYQKITPVIFTGMISQAWSVKPKVDYITQIESFDGGFAFNNSNKEPIPAIPSGTTRQQAAKTVAANFPGVQQGFIKLGTVGSLPGTLSRDNSYAGHPVDVLRQLTGDGFFIDNNTIYILSDNECVPANGITQIDSNTGLLGTPVREQSILHFTMLFEPRLVMAQELNLVSLDPSLSGIYKVISLHHYGMISPTTCGDALTEVGLYAPLAGQSLSLVGEG